jgi:hypothetical protein
MKKDPPPLPLLAMLKYKVSEVSAQLEFVLENFRIV